MKKAFWFIVGFIVLVTLVLQVYKDVQISGDVVTVIRETKEVSINTFVQQYNERIYEKIILEDDVLLQGYVFVKTGESTNLMSLNADLQKRYVDMYTTKKPREASLEELGITITGVIPVEVTYTEKSFWEGLLETVGPLLLFLIAFFFIAKMMLPKSGSMPFSMKIGKLSTKADVKTKFKDIAGMKEEKEELSEIVDFLKNPDKYTKVGARHPKGVLLYGQPGSGKTLLARAVAGESHVPFFSASGSEFMEMLVGMGASKVRELFRKAKAAGKAIIFIDEIDAIGKKRGAGHTGGHQEQEQTLNQILTEMDGFDNDTSIVVIAATNRPDVLDPALLRAGRFDRKVMVSRPTYDERVLIFQYYLTKKKMASDVKIESIAKRTSGLVGADIENIVNEASLKIAREDRKQLENSDFEYALEKVIMGPEKKIQSMKEKEKHIIAYHELGHAVTAHLLPQADPVEKISIVSRGQALGVTRMMPEEDKYLHSKAKFLDEVVSLLGGRAAEEIFFGKDEITTGAANDFEKATKIITDMVVKYGMDEDLGPIFYHDKDKEDYFLTKTYSEKTAELIDEKIKFYINNAYKKSLQLIKANKKLMEKMAALLLEKEYITKQEFVDMMEDITKVDEYMQQAKEHKQLLVEKAKKNKKD